MNRPARRGRDRGRVTAAKVNLLATDAEITAFAAELGDHLKEWDRSARIGELPDFEDIWLGDGTLTDDFFRDIDTGTEAFAKKTPQELDQILGWTGSGLPAAFVKKHADDTPVEVMWHQKTALASILARAFEPTEPPIDDRTWGKAPGMILTDAVGTGKTIIALALIASLIQLRGIQIEGLIKPPIMSTEQFCGHPGGIPNAPHLIVAPGTILDQWISEACRFFKPGAVELIKVDAQGSKWANALLRLDDSSYPDICKIVLVQHSTVNTMGARTLLPMGVNDSDLMPLGTTVVGRKTTLFGRHFASIWVDEAHEYRTGQKQFRNCNTLMDCALLKTLATATPLKQHARDVFYLSVLARMPLVMEPKTQEPLRAILADLARVKRKARKTGVALAPDGAVRLDTTDIETTTHHKFAAHIVHILRQASLPRTIRRTTESLRWDGKRIGDELPQNIFTYIMVPMTEEEIRAAGVYTNAANVNFDTTNENFFFEPRRTISFPGKAAHNNYTEHVFDTKQDWMTSTHSKMTALSRLQRRCL
ncbi:hypothetical protein BDZ89DRAFT_312517 [Hymenopellis radicata]|nr:hypothetical protein BDZ89DRAFT_312517 [Hymenopellis radicata]